MRSRWFLLLGVLCGVMVMTGLQRPASAGEQDAPEWSRERGEILRFPPAVGVVDVKKQFGAVGDGKSDDTAALQKAFDQTEAFVYIPAGTYLVRDRLIWNSRPGIGPTIVGESRDSTIIRLAPDAAGYGDPEQPKAVIQLVRDRTDKRGVSADQFKTKIRNLTIDASGHAGAIGLVFYANNNGYCRNVRIVGNGVAGLDLSRELNGPLLVSNVQIDGFARGVVAGSGPFNSQPLEHIDLAGQREYGLYNDGECLSIRGLRSRNRCVAVSTRGNLTLIDSELVADADTAPDTAAITNAGWLFLRNVDVQRYAAGVRTPTGTAPLVVAGRIAEFATGPRDAPATPDAGVARSLALPIEDAPYEPPPADFDQWVCVNDFGAVADDRTDDSDALRRAIEHAHQHAKSVIAFGPGRYTIGGRFVFDRSISRIQGAGTFLVPPTQDDSLELVVGDGPGPVFTMDLVDRPLGPKLKVIVENASNRALVVRGMRAKIACTGSGRTFLEDSASGVEITHPEHRVWARQLNTESSSETNNVNRGGTLWVLGLKTERDQTLIRTEAGGKTEVLGGWVYVIAKQPPSKPMFEVTDATLGLSGVLQFHSRGMVYRDLVRVTRANQTNVLTREENGSNVISTYVTRP